MSLDAHVIAVGPHSPELAHHYEYAPANYDSVPRGQMICTQIGVEAHCRTLAEELCEVLGCSAESPRSWTLDPARIDQAALADRLDQNELDGLLQAIRDLSNAGFTFFLRVDS